MFSKKVLLFLTIIGLIIYSCNNDDDDPVEEFDHAAQAIIDNDSIVSFLSKHYFDENVDSIRPIDAGQTALIKDTSRLFTKKIPQQNIDYFLYYFLEREGKPRPEKKNPTIMDSVLTRYRGVYLKDTDNVVEFEKQVSATWFTLNSTIPGWTYGFTNFRGGENITGNGPIQYTNSGKGILFIPSGLAYRNNPTIASIPVNSSLVFYIELLDIIENTDQDRNSDGNTSPDGIPSILEDPDGDGDPRNDNTDGDLLPNYLDNDDDNDGVLTRDEVERKIYTKGTDGMSFASKSAAEDFFKNNISSNPNEILFRVVKTNGSNNYVLHTTVITNSSNADSPDLPDYLDPNYPNNN